MQVADHRQPRARRDQRCEPFEIDAVVLFETPIEPADPHAKALGDSQQRLVGGALDDHLVASPGAFEHDGRGEPVGEARPARHGEHLIAGDAIALRDRLAERGITVADRQIHDQVARAETKQSRWTQRGAAPRQVDAGGRVLLCPPDVVDVWKGHDVRRREGS